MLIKTDHPDPISIGKNLEVLWDNWESDAPMRIVCFEGSTRSSKTWSIIEFIANIMVQVEGFSSACFRNDRETARDTVIQDMDEFLELRDEEADPSREGMFWRSAIRWKEKGMRHHCPKTGSFLRYGGTRNVKKIHGAANDLVWLNEVMEIAFAAYAQLRYRCRYMMLMDWNPSLTQHWVFEKILANRSQEELIKQARDHFAYMYKDVVIEPADEVIVELAEGDLVKPAPAELVKIDMPNVVYVHSTYKDNVHLPPDQVADIEMFEPTPENKREGTADDWHWKVYGQGLRGMVPGAIYKNIRVWNEIDDGPLGDGDLPPHWPHPSVCVFHSYGLDFGGSHPTVLLDIRMHNNKLYIHELCHAPDMAVMRPADNPDYPSIQGSLEDNRVSKKKEIYADSAAKQSITDLRVAGYKVIGFNKNKYPVLDGIRTMQSYEQIFSPSSMKTFGQNQRYKWKELANGHFANEPVKKDDDAPDAGRYGTVMKVGGGNPLLNKIKGGSKIVGVGNYGKRGFGS